MAAITLPTIPSPTARSRRATRDPVAGAPGGGPTAGTEARTSLWLFIVALVVLAIGCSNVINLSLSRALTPPAELAVKRALGIGTGRLADGVVLEAALLSALPASQRWSIAHGTSAAPLAALDSLRIAQFRCLPIAGR